MLGSSMGDLKIWSVCIRMDVVFFFYLYFLHIKIKSLCISCCIKVLHFLVTKKKSITLSHHQKKKNFLTMSSQIKDSVLNKLCEEVLAKIFKSSLQVLEGLWNTISFRNLNPFVSIVQNRILDQMLILFPRLKQSQTTVSTSMAKGVSTPEAISNNNLDIH